MIFQKKNSVQVQCFTVTVWRVLKGFAEEQRIIILVSGLDGGMQSSAKDLYWFWWMMVTGSPRPDTVAPFLSGTFPQSFCQFGTWTAILEWKLLLLRTEIFRNDALYSISSWTLCVLRSHYVAPVVGIVILHTSYSL